MEYFYVSCNDMQASKVHSFDGNVSPINAQNFIGRGCFYPGSKTPILDPYASSESTGSSSNIVSPLAGYFCPCSPVSFTSNSPKHRSLVNTSSGSRSSSSGGVSRLPLASLENIEIPLMFRTPVKVEEDVVVMDGILVEPKNGPRAKLSPLTSDSGGRLSSSTLGKDNSFHKSETCRWWEDFGSCRFGSKCRVSLFSFLSFQRNTIQMLVKYSCNHVHLYTGKKIYAQLLSPTEIHLRHCSADHTVLDHLLMDQRADLFITRSTQPRLLQKQQHCPPQLLLLLLLKCLLKTKSPQAVTIAPLPPPPVLSLAQTGVPWMIMSRSPCLLLVKIVLRGKMLMLIYRLFSMAPLEGRDCRYSLTLLRSRYAILTSQFKPSILNKGNQELLVTSLCSERVAGAFVMLQIWHPESSIITKTKLSNNI